MKPRRPMKPCKCGYRRRTTHYFYNGKYFYRCEQCGFKSSEGKTLEEAKALWNNEVSHDKVD